MMMAQDFPYTQVKLLPTSTIAQAQFHPTYADLISSTSFSFLKKNINNVTLHKLNTDEKGDKTHPPEKEIYIIEIQLRPNPKRREEKRT